MRLRRQLILVSLLTLCLPWAGCQYLREMESALREGQSRALLATAEAVANRIASEPLLAAELTRNATQGATERQLYAHPLSGPLLVDGYDEDWRHLPFTPHRWQLGQRTLDLRAAHHQRQVYLLVRVRTPGVHYYHPGQADLADADHLRLRSLDRDGRLRDFALVASAPGMTSAYDLFQPRISSPSADAPDPFSASPNEPHYYRQEHAIKGVWQDMRDGYQVEILMPWYLTQGYLGVAAVMPGGDGALWLGSISPDSAPAPLMRHSDSLRDAIGIFAGSEMRLRIASSNQWLLAEAGGILRDTPDDGDWETRLLRRLVLRGSFPSLDTPERDGRLTGDEVTRALRGEPSTHWYQYHEHKLARAAAPVIVNGQPLGAVLAEQTGESLSALTHTAFRRLVFYTLLTSLLAGLGLLAYASWLSLRIRRLSRVADTAIREDGKLENAFVPSTASDELGDLSRSYHQLLTRVQEYTDYLRSLSNKLSHELRTPLAVVRSSLDNLDQENLSPDAGVFATRAREGSQRLSAIINAMSAASRIEESIKQADMVHFPLDKLLSDLTNAYQGVARQRLVCDIAGDTDFYLTGSPDLIVQMIDKLFDNACDFCPADGEIVFSLLRDKQQLILAVSNDGPPLPQTMQRQLFDSLVSIRDGHAADRENGKIHLGLGLHIVRLIAELHQAQVAAHNREDGRGVTFKIIFPAE